MPPAAALRCPRPLPCNAPGRCPAMPQPLPCDGSGRCPVMAPAAALRCPRLLLCSFPALPLARCSHPSQPGLMDTGKSWVLSGQSQAVLLVRGEVVVIPPHPAPPAPSPSARFLHLDQWASSAMSLRASCGGCIRVLTIASLPPVPSRGGLWAAPPKSTCQSQLRFRLAPRSFAPMAASRRGVAGQTVPPCRPPRPGSWGG